MLRIVFIGVILGLVQVSLGRDQDFGQTDTRYPYEAQGDEDLIVGGLAAVKNTNAPVLNNWAFNVGRNREESNLDFRNNKSYSNREGNVRYSPRYQEGDRYNRVAPDVCSYQKRRGHCGEYHKRFYFSLQREECLPFIYSGCGGSPNRFRSLGECVATCERRRDPEGDYSYERRY